MQPLSNAYVATDSANGSEIFYPLHARVCGRCHLVQIPQLELPENIFANYAYLSSVSESWLEHCKCYAIEVAARFQLGASSSVVEVASNDGYLLRFFQGQGIPVLGIEPADNVADIAIHAGVPTMVRFFGSAVAEELVASGTRADLLIGNNVLAHVPDLNDFVRGLRILLAPNGVITMEFPHLSRLIEQRQFDTIYHEHFSYFSLFTAMQIFAAHGITIFDVDELPTHGGSLRIYGCHAAQLRGRSKRVDAVLANEEEQRLLTVDPYALFAERVRDAKRKLLEFFIPKRRAGCHVVAYGAAAKGNTLLNYCGMRTDFIDYVVDRNPIKQGKLLPGTHIPIMAPERIRETRPEWILVLPWNLRSEIANQLAFVKEWGCQLVVPIPDIEVLA